MFTVAYTFCRLLEVKKGNERGSHRTDGITDFEITKKKDEFHFLSKSRKSEFSWLRVKICRHKRITFPV